MSQETTSSAPVIFEGGPVTELIVPVVADRRYERGIALALEWAQKWEVPTCLVHVGPVDSVAPSGVARLAQDLHHRHPGLAIDSLTFDHVDVAAGLRSVATSRSLIVLASDRAAEWVHEDSVAERLTQHSDDPLLLLGPHCSRQHPDGPIVVALDGSTPAEASLRPALGIAAVDDVAVHLVSIVPSATVEQIEHLKQRGTRVSESSYLRSVAERCEAYGRQVHWEIIHGEDPVAELVTFASRLQAAMIVATSHAATGLGRHLFGSTAMGLVERSEVPVLVVTPPADGLQRF